MRPSPDIERAIRAYGDAVWRACLLYLQPSDAEDVFQDVFLKYALHDEPFNDAEHAKAWLVRVAVNACKDVLKTARQRNLSADELAAQGRLADLGCTDDESAHNLLEVRDALNALGDPPKTQLYLSLYEGYSAPEIAQMTNMPVNTVYSWIARGKKQLRRALS